MQWTKYSEMPPKGSELILIFTRSHAIELVCFDNGEFYLRDGDVVPGKDVTHWMPAPGAPE